MTTKDNKKESKYIDIKRHLSLANTMCFPELELNSLMLLKSRDSSDNGAFITVLKENKK
jgi:hypothetical protein